MSQPKLGVVAVGNALVDVIAQTSDEFITGQTEEYGMEKGAMTLIEEPRAVELYMQMPEGTETSGGSAANTMAGFASFGGKGGFIGKVAEDELGKTFQEDIPLNMFVFPSNNTAELPESFVAYADIPDTPATVDPDAIAANREAWIAAWTDVVLR